MNSRKVILSTDYIEPLSCLEDDEQGRILMSVLKHFAGEVVLDDLTTVEMAVYLLIIRRIEMEEAWQEKE